jgi:hypothetical protein
VGNNIGPGWGILVVLDTHGILYKLNLLQGYTFNDM